MRETWKYRRSPSVDAALTELTAEGYTLEEACISAAKKVLIGERRCDRAAHAAVDCFLMGISTENEYQSVKDIISSDGDFFSTGRGMGAFRILCGMKDIYGYKDASSLEYLDMCFAKLSAALPSMAAVPDDRADECINIMKNMYGLTDTFLKHRRDEFEESLLQLAAAPEKQPAVYGAAMGLLCSFDGSRQSDAQAAMRGYLSGSAEVKKLGADYLRGLFSAARDIVFSGNDFIMLTDELINELDSDEFIEILPCLKLAFGSFTPQEIRRTAETVASLYETNEDLLSNIPFDEGLYNFGKILDTETADAINSVNIRQ